MPSCSAKSGRARPCCRAGQTSMPTSLLTQPPTQTGRIPRVRHQRRMAGHGVRLQTTGVLSPQLQDRRGNRVAGGEVVRGCAGHDSRDHPEAGDRRNEARREPGPLYPTAETPWRNLHTGATEAPERRRRVNPPGRHGHRSRSHRGDGHQPDNRLLASACSNAARVVGRRNGAAHGRR